LWDRAWTDTEWAVFPYTIQCVSAQKARCYQRLINAIRNYYVSRGGVENDAFDYGDYGGGPNPPNIAEHIIDEMFWTARMGEIEDECSAIP
jgi:hypothetical protein